MWRSSRIELLLLVATAGSLFACRQDMHDQAKLEPLEHSDVFVDGRGSRHEVPGTVARGELAADRHLYEGKLEVTPAAAGDGGEESSAGGSTPTGQGGGSGADHEPMAEADTSDVADTFPHAMTIEDLKRGRERYDIFCSPCHARTGDGDGMVVRRGFRRPSSLHVERLREAKPGHLYDVINNGFGAMPAYGRRMSVRDRWAIVAYIRALQLSRNAPLEVVPAAERARLEEAASKPAAGTEGGEE